MLAQAGRPRSDGFPDLYAMWLEPTRIHHQGCHFHHSRVAHRHIYNMYFLKTVDMKAFGQDLPS